jgi:glycosyltransferase involved in cell wall biosynthesis
MKQRKKTYYFFPINAKGNTYVEHFVTALANKHVVVNIGDREKQQKIFRSFMLDMVRYFKADVFVFNWTEFLSMGINKLGMPLFVMMTCLYRLFGKKIIWFLHNKHTYHEKPSFSSKWLMTYQAFIANVVITYSKEGIDFCKNNLYKNAKIFYFPHPVYPEAVKIDIAEKYDIIIWGTINPYKRVLDFLKYYNQNETLKQLKLLICGQCRDMAYNKQILEQITPNVTYLNEFVSTKKLNEYLSVSKNILFPYETESVLCSGALVYSIAFGKKIIAPEVGAFKDYEKYNFVSTYKSFNEIESLLTHNNENNAEIVAQFCEKYTWEKFIEKVDTLLL